MKIIKLILFLCILFPITAFGDHNYFENFENETVDTAWQIISCLTYPTIYRNTVWYHDQYCYDLIEDDINDRSSPNQGQYLTLYCNWEVDSSTYPKRSQRASLHFGHGDDWGSACHSQPVNDAQEYWFGYSIYLPSDYYIEYCNHSSIQWTEDDGTILQAIGFGGGTDGACQGNGYSDHEYLTGRIYHGSLTYFELSGNDPQAGSPIITTADLVGKWTDFVWHHTWYDTNHANAVTELWINGVLIYSYEDVKTVEETGKKVILNAPFLYSALATSPSPGGYDDFNRWWNEEGDTQFVRWREDLWDEYRHTSDSIGIYDYCDVAPPIWAKQVIINSPTPAQSGLSTTFNVTYDAYADHRTDAQSCFSASKMEIEIDENGGDWGTLVYNSGTIAYAASPHEVSGLLNNTNYQLRVRHSSTARSTEYWGEWSDTRYFTTGNYIAKKISVGTKIDIGGTLVIE